MTHDLTKQPDDARDQTPGRYPAPAPAGYPPAPQGYGSPQPYYGQAPAGYGPSASPFGPSAYGPLGQIRGTGFGILMTIITLGIYPLYWFYATHEEMKRHTGEGLGGGLALVIAFFIAAAQAFITSSEVGNLYARRGQRPPVTGLNGLWYFPGVFILVGPLIWFVTTNGTLNAYWRSLGAR